MDPSSTSESPPPASVREALPQSSPNTLMFQAASSKTSIPLSVLRLSRQTHPPTSKNSKADENGPPGGGASPLSAAPPTDEPEVSSSNPSEGIDNQGLENQGVAIPNNLLESQSSLPSSPPQSPTEVTPPVRETSDAGSNPEHYEALLHVLQLLPIEFRLSVVPLVCKEWRDAAYDPVCWTHVELGEVRFREGLLEAAREIHWDASPRQIQGLIKAAVGRSAGMMQSFRGLIPTTEALFVLPAGCPNLKTLRVPRSFRAVNNDALAAAARGCPGLTSLDVSECLKVTEVGMIQVATFCKDLQRLSVAGNFQFSNWSLASIAINCRGLRHLDVSGSQRVRDDGLEILASKCSGLVTLDLGGCRQVTDQGVCEVARNCTNLESLGLGNCRNLTDASVTEVAVNCSRLTVVNISNVEKLTDAGVFALAAHGTNVTDVNMGGCFRITDEGVLRLVRNCARLSRLSVRGCAKLSDVSLAAIAERQLYYLDVRGCRGMSEGMIQQVMQARNNQKRRLVSSYGL